MVESVAVAFGAMVVDILFSHASGQRHLEIPCITH